MMLSLKQKSPPVSGEGERGKDAKAVADIGKKKASEANVTMVTSRRASLPDPILDRYNKEGLFGCPPGKALGRQGEIVTPDEAAAWQRQVAFEKAELQRHYRMRRIERALQHSRCQAGKEKKEKIAQVKKEFFDKSDQQIKGGSKFSKAALSISDIPSIVSGFMAASGWMFIRSADDHVTFNASLAMLTAGTGLIYFFNRPIIIHIIALFGLKNALDAEKALEAGEPISDKLLRKAAKEKVFIDYVNGLASQGHAEAQQLQQRMKGL